MPDGDGVHRFSVGYLQFLHNGTSNVPWLRPWPRARGSHGGTRTVGIIGWPVSHSLSPAIHNAAFAAMGLDWVYVPLPGRIRLQLSSGARGLAPLGFAGANVTMPHKTEVADGRRYLPMTPADCTR